MSLLLFLFPPLRSTVKIVKAPFVNNSIWKRLLNWLLGIFQSVPKCLLSQSEWKALSISLLKAISAAPAYPKCEKTVRDGGEVRQKIRLKCKHKHNHGWGKIWMMMQMTFGIDKSKWNGNSNRQSSWLRAVKHFQLLCPLDSEITFRWSCGISFTVRLAGKGKKIQWRHKPWAGWIVLCEAANFALF